MKNNNNSIMLMLKINRYLKESKYDEILSMINELEKESVISSNLLVIKGRCIQVSDNNKYQLSDAENAFKSAIKLDSNNIEALFELGYFYLNVNDDPVSAIPLFEKVATICSNWINEAVSCKAMCLIETDSKEKAIRFIQNYNVIDKDNIISAL